MAEMFVHPKTIEGGEQEFVFADGSKILLTPAPGEFLQVKDAIYMLEDCKVQILTLMR
jgi:hypothetical protein